MIALTLAASLVLLGTAGGPTPKKLRAAPSQAIVVGDRTYLVDAGNGVGRQIRLAGIPFTSVRHLFLTHHHSDHAADLVTLPLLAWAAGLETTVTLHGPKPIKHAVKAGLKANAFDIETRIADEGRPDLRRLVVAHEFDRPGAVVKTELVTVTAARVFHPPVDQSYAYRFDTADRSIVISGDTGPSRELVTLATGADILVHEVMHLGGVESLLKRVPNAATLRVNLVRHHTSTDDVGKIAAAAGVKTLVLTHFVPPDDPAVTEEMWLEGVRKHYSGRIVMGQDLLEL